MKTGTGQFAPFRWTTENLFDTRTAFKMSDGKKQKSTKLPQTGCPRSGKKSGKKVFIEGQGILKFVREFWSLSKSQGKVREL